MLDGRPAPAAVLSDRFVSTSSLTKAYGLASLRCGWALASPDVAESIRRARDVVDVWAPMPADRLSVVAFAHLDRLRSAGAGIVEANRAAVSALLESRPELEWVPPRSTLAFPRLAGVADAGPFVDRLFRETGTAVAPGPLLRRAGPFPDRLRRRPRRACAKASRRSDAALGAA